MREKIVVALLIVLFGGSIIVGCILILTAPPKPQAVPEGFGSPFRLLHRDVVGIVHIYGELRGGSGRSLSDMGGADSIIRRLRTLGEDKRVKAIILRIDSPGGSVGASQEIYQEVERLRKKGIRMVASVCDMGASGAYYVASACDHIVANPGSLVGSIGVVMVIPDLSGLTGGILRVDIQTIKSGEFKDMGSPFRRMSQVERTKFQEIVNDAYEQFKNVVLESRRRVHPGESFDQQWVDAHLQGLVFTGQQALDANLVDELGGLEEAKAAARRLAGLGEDITYVTEQRTLLDLLLGQLGVRAGAVERLAGRVNNLQEFRLAYLFCPGL